MTAREKFKIADRVRLSAAGQGCFVRRKPGPDCRATVVGYGRHHDDLIVVRRDGRKSNETFSMEFWEHANDGELPIEPRKEEPAAAK